MQRQALIMLATASAALGALPVTGTAATDREDDSDQQQGAGGYLGPAILGIIKRTL